MRRLPGLLALLLASSCFLSRQTVNQPIVLERLRELEPGRSTSSDVVRELGAPSEVIQLGRRSAYRYDFTTEKTAGFTVIVVTFVNADTRSDRVWVFFDEDGLLTHVGTTLQGERAEYAMPWQDLEH